MIQELAFSDKETLERKQGYIQALVDISDTDMSEETQ